MEEKTQPLSGGSGVRDTRSYHSNLIKTNISTELMEEDDQEVGEPETGLTEIIVTIEGKEIKTLTDTGSEISVTSKNVLGAVSYTHLSPISTSSISLSSFNFFLFSSNSFNCKDVYKRQV